MASAPPHTFTLDRSLWNQSLYSEIHNFWFAGLPEDATAPNMATGQRWFGIGKSDEQKAEFDEECRSKAGPALEAIGPSKLSLPPFKSYENEMENADSIAAPFLNEVKAAQQEDGKTGARTLLSLILLLDQMPRNIYRQPDGLRMVYQHYDRLAYALLHSSMAMKSDPTSNDLYFGRPVYQLWFKLPLVHSEHIPSHERLMQMSHQSKHELEGSKDKAALTLIERGDKSTEEHTEILRRFSRYPHRNECLGRASTPEEIEYLKTANTFTPAPEEIEYLKTANALGVKQNQKRARDEL